MRKTICLLLAVCLLAGCGLAGAESPHPQGKPWINSNLMINIPDERPPVEDGLEMYANYDVYKEARDRGISLQSLEEAEEVSRTQILSLCRDVPAECAEDEILKVLYGFITDSEKRNADGLAPLMAKVNRLKAAETVDDLLSLIQEEGFMAWEPIFSTAIQESTTGSGNIVIYLGRKNLLEEKSPDHDLAPNEYFMPEKETEKPKSQLIRIGYGEEEAAALVERMKEYDNYFPEDFSDLTDGNLLTIEQVKEKCLPLYAQLVGMGLVKEGPVYEVFDTEVFGLANHFFTAEYLDLLKAIIALSMYKASVAYLDEETWHTEGYWFEDFGPDKNVYNLLTNTCVIAVDQAYLKHFCPEENREMVVALYEELKDAMRVRIRENTWMDEETKKTALEKLELINVAPFTAEGGVFDCEPLKTALQSCTTLLEAASACQTFRQQSVMSRYVGEPFIRGSRYLPSANQLMDSNGEYRPQQNMIFIGMPALNMPICNSKSRETLLGTIGHHLGHELSHAFSVGALTDATGQRPLYSAANEKLFTEKLEAMIGKMNQIELMDGVMLNGKITISELLADVTGVSLALDLAKKTEDFDYVEFFLTFASVFRTCSPDLEEMRRGYLGMNPHPSPYVRINYTAAQFEEFYEAFPSVTEGTPMYIAPEDRILIW